MGEVNWSQSASSAGPIRSRVARQSTERRRVRCRCRRENQHSGSSPQTCHPELPTGHSHGIAPFDRLVEQLMTRPPYNDARRVFWIVDKCSSHGGLKAAERLRNRYSHLKLVHARSTKSQKDEPDFFWGEGQMLKVLQSIGATDDRHPTSWENRFMGMVAGAILMVSFRRHGDEQVRRFSQL